MKRKILTPEEKETKKLADKEWRKILREEQKDFERKAKENNAFLKTYIIDQIKKQSSTSGREL